MRIDVEKAFGEEAWAIYYDKEDVGSVIKTDDGFRAQATLGGRGQPLRVQQLGEFPSKDMAVGAVVGAVVAQHGG